MDVERFARELPGLFEQFPQSEHPRDRRLARVLEEVPGLARENNLALLNLAASLLRPGESYVEVGTFRGTSLISAMLGNDGEFVGVDNFSMGDTNREELDANLRRFNVEPTVLEGDAFELIPRGALEGRTVGVYYYDDGHKYELQLNGLQMVEPYLAESALLIVDDTDWKQVEQAMNDYLAAQPKARLLVEIPGKDRGLPHWWEGVQVLAWEDRAGPLTVPGTVS